MTRLLLALTALLVSAKILPLSAQQTQVMIVTGVSGEPRFAKAFRQYGGALVTAARERFGIPDSLLYYFGEDTTGVASADRPRARATKENIERALTAMASRAKAGDQLAILLFGHGSEQGEPRISLPGPDLTAADFARLLAPVRDATVIVVNAASASGEFAKVLAGPNRVIVTATKSSREANETVFPEYFVNALATGAGDADKDGRVSILEAFSFAKREVERFYETASRLATEHPQLEDDGDGTARANASAAGPDGRRASTTFLEPAGGARLANDPRALQLLSDRRAVELKIDSLRARRTQMTEDAYQKALEPLLIELAEKTQALRALEGKKP